MKKYYLIFVIILTLSCFQKKTEKQITEFESILGERQTKALDNLVFDFEQNLIEIYPDLPIEEGYSQYLIDIKSDTITKWDKFKFQSKNTIMEYYKSGLHDEIYNK